MQKYVSKIKQDISVFYASLQFQRIINNITWPGDILIGNKDPALRLVVVLSPYCKSCGIEFQGLCELMRLHSNQLSLTLRFVVNPNEANIKTKTVSHLLSALLESQENERLSILERWFRKTDLSLLLKESGQKKYITPELLWNHHNWYTNNKITKTPSLFINEHELPEVYHARDLLFFIPKILMNKEWLRLNLSAIMNRTNLADLVARSFPNAIGSLITGSQKDMETYRENSDVDIVVFDLSYPHIVFLEMFYDGIKIDCTVISLNNISNILANEYNDSKGIVLKMIQQGTALTGDLDMLNEIKVCIKECFAKLDPRNSPAKDRLILALRWLHKYLQRELSPGERFVLMCEFVNKMTSLKSVELAYWEIEYLHKVQLLERHDHNFISELNSIFNFTVATGDHGIAIDFIERQALMSNGNNPIQQSGYITLDISIDNFSLPVFVNTHLKEITSNDILKDCYQYFYVPDGLYAKTYKYSICICFKLASRQMLQKIVSELNLIFSTGVTFNLKYNILKLMPDLEFVNTQNPIVELRKMLSHIFIDTPAGQNDISLVQLAIYICEELITILELEKPDTYQLCQLMIDRWGFTPQELLLQQHKNNFFNTLHNRKSDLVAEYSRHTKKSNGFISNSYQQATVGRLSSVLSDSIHACSDKSVLPFFPKLTLEQLVIANAEKSYTFLYLLPEILQSLNLTTHQKALTLAAFIQN